MRFTDKVAIVTGGASGIGAATAKLLTDEGAFVYITDIQNEMGQALAAKLGGTFISHDVSSEAAWQKVTAQVRSEKCRLDVLVNNAGTFMAGNIEETELDLWDKVIAVNLTGTMLGCREAIKVMKDNPGGPKGSIVNVSSITGYIGLASGAAYTASKGGVRLLTKSVAVHCARTYQNIRCNSVHPGAIDTPMNQVSFDASGDPEAARAFFDTVQPIGRMGLPEEIAQAIAHLGSDGASFITGTELLVDGGWLAAAGPV